MHICRRAAIGRACAPDVEGTQLLVKAIGGGFMRIRAVGPAAIVVTALLVGACGGNGATTAPTGTKAPATTAGGSPAQSSSAGWWPTVNPQRACKWSTNAALPSPADLKITVIADI